MGHRSLAATLVNLIRIKIIDLLDKPSHEMMKDMGEIEIKNVQQSKLHHASRRL
jgi:hypothetical protein